MTFIETVQGPLPPGKLGVTLYHEHLAMNPGPQEKYRMSIFDNPDEISRELSDFKKYGGGTFVDMSPLNFGRNVLACKYISEKTGVNVICCTGFHNEKFIPEWVHSKSDRDIESIVRAEIEDGIDGSGIRAGVIKLGSSSDFIHPVEQRLFGIISSVHKLTGIPISTHCDKGLQALEQCKLFIKHGVKPDRVLLGHVDIPNDADHLKKICDLGFNVGIDHIGRDLENHDQIKLAMIGELVEEGYINQIFIAGDMGKKNYLKIYGGAPGFGYIVSEFKQLFLNHGMDSNQFDQIMVENPKRFFQPDKTNE